jgi:hypothetical protein
MSFLKSFSEQQTSDAEELGIEESAKLRSPSRGDMR